MKPLACLTVALVLTAPAVAQDMALSSILVEGQGWNPVAKGFKSVTGLAADAEGRLYVADGVGKRVARIDKDGTVTTLVETPAAPTGLAFASGALLVCLPDKVVELDLARPSVLPTRAELKAVGVAVSKQGTAYYAVPTEHSVYAQDKDGKPRKVAEGVAEPAGLTFSGGGGTLFVADAAGKFIYAFRVRKDGGLDAQEGYSFMRLPHEKKASGAGGMTTDPIGRFYVAAATGLHSYDPTGRLNGVLLNPLPTIPTAVALGGPDGETLFIGGGEEVFGRKIHAKPQPKK